MFRFYKLDKRTVCFSASLLDLSPIGRMMAICLTASMTTVARCPLTTFLAFTKKKSIDKRETKQNNQEKEREHALRER